MLQPVCDEAETRSGVNDALVGICGDRAALLGVMAVWRPVDVLLTLICSCTTLPAQDWGKDQA